MVVSRRAINGGYMDNKENMTQELSTQEIVDKVLTKRLHRERQNLAAKLGLNNYEELDAFISTYSRLKVEHKDLEHKVKELSDKLIEKDNLIKALLKSNSIDYMNAFLNIAISEVIQGKTVDDALYNVTHKTSKDHLLSQVLLNHTLSEKEFHKMKQKIDKILNVMNKMSEPYKSYGYKIHEIVTEVAPHLIPDLWYGSVSYKDPNTKKVICFFRLDQQFTLGLGEDANFEFNKDTASKIQPSSWFLNGMNAEVESTIKEIIKVAVK